MSDLQDISLPLVILASEPLCFQRSACPYILFSFGWWLIPQSRLWFAGLRTNWGVRLEEGLTEENPDNRVRAQVEASVVIDAGIEIYSPVALYLRVEPFSLVVRGLGSGAQGNQVTAESFLNGRGAITLGLRFDLANVY